MNPKKATWVLGGKHTHTHTHTHTQNTQKLPIGKTGKQTGNVLNVMKAGCLDKFPPGEKDCQNKLNLLSPRSPNTGQLMPISE